MAANSDSLSTGYENRVVSTVKMNCGCSLSYSGSPAYVVESAIRHVQQTGHSVDIVGVIKPAVKKAKLYVPPYKFKRNEDVGRTEV